MPGSLYNRKKETIEMGIAQEREHPLNGPAHQIRRGVEPRLSYRDKKSKPRKMLIKGKTTKKD